MYGYDLDPSLREGDCINPETWSGIDARQACEQMYATVPAKKRPTLGDAPSLLRLANACDPLAITESLAERLARLCPGALADIRRAQEEHNLNR